MKVLIADDEDRVCRLIYRLIKWDELDMEVAAIAHNGLEVLSMIEEHRPDIVITDIRMPGLDGLEMIRRAKELDGTLEFIIISGYRHFEYAQNAIRYGAGDYLLKPVKEAELYSVLERMRNQYQMRHNQITQEERYKALIQNNRDRLRTTFFTDVVLKHSAPERINSLEWINETYHYEFSEGYFQIVILKVDSIAFNREENLDYIQKKIVDLAGKKLKALVFDKEYFLEESRCMILLNYRPEKEMEIYKAFKSLINELMLQNDIFESLKVTAGLGSTEKEAVFDFVSEVILTSMGEAVKRKQEEGKRPIREAKNYIRLHYKDALTLEKVSGVVDLNASYLSALFKKETGKTFLEYLTKVRMDKAKEMLKETNETISAICQEVGYSDTKYFVKCFQKYTGLKPNQYRKVYS